MAQTKTFANRAQWAQHCKDSVQAFLKTYQGRYVVKHIREDNGIDYFVDGEGAENPGQLRKQRGRPTGTLVAYRDAEDNIKIGWSAIDKRDYARYDRNESIYRAIQRATFDDAKPPIRRIRNEYQEFTRLATIRLTPSPKD